MKYSKEKLYVSIMESNEEQIPVLIMFADERQASDLYIRENSYSYIRDKMGNVIRIGSAKGSPKVFSRHFQSFFENTPIEDITKIQSDLDFSYQVSGINCRCHFYRTIHGMALAIRILPRKIPTLNQLGLPDSVSELLKEKSGLVIVSGPTGSGKSTTLAAMINAINMSYPYHIITLENPVEYIFDDNKSIISQIEIGKNINSFSDGIKAAMRENPNVIMIGELRTLEDIKTALFAAESGHLVLTTLHSGSVVDALDRLLNYEENLQMKNMFANTFKAIIVQKLLPNKDEGKTLCCEVLLRNTATVSCIKDNNYPQLINIMKATPGMMTMQDALSDLIERNLVAPDTTL